MNRGAATSAIASLPIGAATGRSSLYGVTCRLSVRMHFDYRRLAREEVDELVKLLAEGRFSLVGLSGRSFLTSVILDAFKGRGVDVAVAVADRAIVGWSIAIIDPRTYWQGFMLRHPLWALRVAANKLKAW